MQQINLYVYSFELYTFIELAIALDLVFYAFDYF